MCVRWKVPPGAGSFSPKKPHASHPQHTQLQMGIPYIYLLALDGDGQDHWLCPNPSRPSRMLGVQTMMLKQTEPYQDTRICLLRDYGPSY